MRPLEVALRACGVWLGLAATAATLSCGAAAKDFDIGETQRPAVHVDDWPPVAKANADAVNVRAALACADGAQIRVRGYLVALTPPCAACNVDGQRPGSPKVDDRIGRTARPVGPSLPGCLPCPRAAATFSDEPPTASPSPDSAPLRAVGSAEGLQSRHVGRVFLLTGTFHPRGEQGPELDVSDVRAIQEP